MNRTLKIPEQSLIRLSYYLRAVEYYLRQGYNIASSKEFSKFLRISPDQVRKDLSYFGQFGKKGVGYPLKILQDKLRYILGLDREWYSCIVGVGNLAKALSFYRGFVQQGIIIKAGFDVDKKKIGRTYGDMKVYPVEVMPQVIQECKIKIGIITVPATEAQKAADRLVYSGIKAILNFAPVMLDVPSEIVLKNVDLSCQFAYLTYYLESP